MRLVKEGRFIVGVLSRRVRRDGMMAEEVNCRSLAGCRTGAVFLQKSMHYHSSLRFCRVETNVQPEEDEAYGSAAEMFVVLVWRINVLRLPCVEQYGFMSWVLRYPDVP